MKKFAGHFMNEQGSVMLIAVISVILYVVRSCVRLPYVVKSIFYESLFFAIGILCSYMSAALTSAEIKTVIRTLMLFSVPALIWKIYADSARIPWLPWKALRAAAEPLMVAGLIFIVLKASQMLSGRRTLKTLGRQSYSIYLLHQPFCCAFAGLILYDKMHLPALFVCAVCFILSLAVPLTAVWIIRKMPALQKITKRLLNIG